MNEEEKLYEDALDIVCQAGGRIAVTDLLASLRGRGAGSRTANSRRMWKFRGGYGTYELRDELEGLGFTVEHEYKKLTHRCKARREAMTPTQQRMRPCGVYGCCVPSVRATFITLGD